MIFFFIRTRLILHVLHKGSLSVCVYVTPYPDQSGEKKKCCIANLVIYGVVDYVKYMCYGICWFFFRVRFRKCSMFEDDRFQCLIDGKNISDSSPILFQCVFITIASFQWPFFCFCAYFWNVYSFRWLAGWPVYYNVNGLTHVDRVQPTKKWEGKKLMHSSILGWNSVNFSFSANYGHSHGIFQL